MPNYGNQYLSYNHPLMQRARIQQSNPVVLAEQLKHIPYVGQNQALRQQGAILQSNPNPVSLGGQIDAAGNWVGGILTGSPSANAEELVIEKPVLTPDGTVPSAPSGPVLTEELFAQPNQPINDTNRRDKTSFGSYIMDKIAAQEAQGQTPLSSRLIRMGAAMQGASHLGRNQAMAAMGQEYGNIEAADQRQQQLQEAALLKHQAKQQEAYQKRVDERRGEVETLDNLDTRFSMALANFELYDNVTGMTPGDIAARLTDWAGMNDSSRQAFRYGIKQIIVDQTLMSTAKTKGAISDKEMALFKSGIPTMNDSEKTWKAWLNERRTWIAIVRNRMVQGIKVDAGADIGFPGYTPPAATQQQQSFTQDDDDALFNIPTKK